MRNQSRLERPSLSQNERRQGTDKKRGLPKKELAEGISRPLILKTPKVRDKQVEERLQEKSERWPITIQKDSDPHENSFAEDEVHFYRESKEELVREFTALLEESPALDESRTLEVSSYRHLPNLEDRSSLPFGEKSLSIDLEEEMFMDHDTAGADEESSSLEKEYGLEEVIEPSMYEKLAAMLEESSSYSFSLDSLPEEHSSIQMKSMSEEKLPSSLDEGSTFEVESSSQVESSSYIAESSSLGGLFTEESTEESESYSDGIYELSEKVHSKGAVLSLGECGSFEEETTLLAELYLKREEGEVSSEVDDGSHYLESSSEPEEEYNYSESSSELEDEYNYSESSSELDVYQGEEVGSASCEESHSFREEEIPPEEIGLPEEDGSLTGKFQAYLEESSSNKEVCEPDRSTLLDEESCLFNDQEDERSHSFKKGKDKKAFPVFKFPVLLAAVQVEVDIQDVFGLEVPIENLIKMEWSSHSIRVKDMLPSNILFIEGMLLAEIDYEAGRSLHSLKIPIPWRKTMEIDWACLPELPLKSNKEFMFTTNDEKEVVYHREQYQQFVDCIRFDLRSLHFVWHEELEKQAGSAALCVNGIAKLSINLLQEQYMNL